MNVQDLTVQVEFRTDVHFPLKATVKEVVANVKSTCRCSKQESCGDLEGRMLVACFVAALTYVLERVQLPRSSAHL